MSPNGLYAGGCPLIPMPIAPLVAPRPRPTPAIVFGTDGLIRLSKFTSEEFSPKNDCGVLVEGFFEDSGSRSSKNEAVTEDRLVQRIL